MLICNDGFMSNYTNYWGKTRPCKRLIYHCLEVAAVGNVLFQQSLQNDKYKDVLTQKITHDKDISLSLITFFVLMHDFGKFSYKWQNKDQGAVKKVHGTPFEQSYYVEHDKLGFLLCHKEIWPLIWHKNLLNVDPRVDKYYLQNVMKSWFRSVTMHHGRNSNIDPKNNPDFFGTYFIGENINNACDFVEEAAKFVLNNNSKKPFLEIQNSLDDTYNNTSKILHYLTKKSDSLVSNNPNYFHIHQTGIIKDYWNEALRYAKQAVKYEKIDSSEIIGKNRYFFMK